MHKYKKMATKGTESNECTEKCLNLPGVAGSSVGTTVAGGEKQLFMNLTFIPERHILHVFYRISPKYLDSQGPGSRSFPSVAPGSLSLHGPGRAVCNL